MPTMSDPKTYEGSCHCGAVRYQVTMAPPEKAYACNCSICARAGWLLAFAPEADFRILSGQDALRDYQFGKKHIHHTFCSTCGIRGFSRGEGTDGKKMVSVNLRCVTGLDWASLPVEKFDGAAL